MGWLNYFDKVTGTRFSEKFKRQTLNQGILKLDKSIGDARKRGDHATANFKQKERILLKEKGLDAEKEFEMHRFGDNEEFNRELWAKYEEAEDPVVKRVYARLRDHHGANYDSSYLRPSPIERLARIKYVVDFPDNIVNIFVNQWETKIKRTDEYRKLKNRKDKIAYLFAHRLMFKKGLRGESLETNDVKHFHLNIPDSLRCAWQDGFEFLGIKNSDTELFVKIREKRKEQMATIKKWVDEFNTNPTIKKNPRFKKLILNTILQWTSAWLDKHEDGTWKEKETRRNKNVRDDFPQIDNYTHDILSQMNEILSNLNKEIRNANYSSEIDNRMFATYGREIMNCAYRGDVRELYYLLRERSRSLDYDLANVTQEKKEYKPEDFEKFSFIKDDGIEKSIEEKEKEVKKLQLKVQDTKSKLCLRQAGDAQSYLNRGDVYVLCVPSMVKIGGEMVPKNIPELAIHVMKDKEGREVVNEKEIHGNADNQGINPEYLQTAKDFVMQKKRVVGEDGIERETDQFRFANAAELGIKFADAVMFNRVKAKIDNLGKIDPETNKPYPDLDARELKFLYQVYRPIRGFELGGSLKTKVEELKKLRYGIIRAKNPIVRSEHFVQLGKINDVEEKQREDDFETMFPGHKNTRFIYYGSVDRQTAMGLEIKLLKEINGRCLGVMRYLDQMQHLEKIAGVVLTEKDRRDLLGGVYVEFPVAGDPRLAEVYLPENEKTVFENGEYKRDD